MKVPQRIRLKTVATVTGPSGKPCCRIGKAMLRGGTKAIDTNRAVRTHGFLDLSAKTAKTNKAPLEGVTTAQTKYRADASCGFSGGVTSQRSAHILEMD